MLIKHSENFCPQRQIIMRRTLNGWVFFSKHPRGLSLFKIKQSTFHRARAKTCKHPKSKDSMIELCVRMIPVYINQKCATVYLPTNETATVKIVFKKLMFVKTETTKSEHVSTSVVLL